MKKSLISICVFMVLSVFVIAGLSAMKKYYVIDPGKCTFCGACFDACPVKNVISEAKVGKKDVYIIDPAKCNGCGECFKVCPEGAISEKTSDISVKDKNGGNACDKKKSATVKTEAIKSSQSCATANEKAKK